MACDLLLRNDEMDCLTHFLFMCHQCSWSTILCTLHLEIMNWQIDFGLMLYSISTGKFRNLHFGNKSLAQMICTICLSFELPLAACLVIQTSPGRLGVVLDWLNSRMDDPTWLQPSSGLGEVICKFCWEADIVGLLNLWEGRCELETGLASWGMGIEWEILVFSFFCCWRSEKKKNWPLNHWNWTVWVSPVLLYWRTWWLLNKIKNLFVL